MKRFSMVVYFRGDEAMHLTGHYPETDEPEVVAMLTAMRDGAIAPGFPAEVSLLEDTAQVLP